MNYIYASDILSRAYLEPSWTSMMEPFYKNSEHLKIANFFRENASP